MKTPVRLQLTTPFFTLIIAMAAGCQRFQPSLYSGLRESEDGVIEADILEGQESGSLIPFVGMAVDQLSPSEATLIAKWHRNQTQLVGFIIADAEDHTIVRSYLAQTPRRLASVTKLSTSLAALKNLKNLDLGRVREMLKTSNNGSASFYIRAAANALTGLVSAGQPWSGHSTCPSPTFLANEYPAADTVFNWLKGQTAHVDWLGGALKDGAGCDYGNQMTPLQVAQVLKLADDQGRVFGGQNYEQFLSISGVDGTWRNHNADAKGRVLAKTGTLNVASNLAGYFYAKRAKTLHKYYFALLVEKSAAEDVRNTRSLAEGLVRQWIADFGANKGQSLGSL